MILDAHDRCCFLHCPLSPLHLLNFIPENKYQRWHWWNPIWKFSAGFEAQKSLDWNWHSAQKPLAIKIKRTPLFLLHSHLEGLIQHCSHLPTLAWREFKVSVPAVDKADQHECAVLNYTGKNTSDTCDTTFLVVCRMGIHKWSTRAQCMHTKK